MGMEDLRSPGVHRVRSADGAAAQRGFSLVEVLVAAGIMLIVALGILPVFSQAIVNNRSGADYTTATNYAKSELERLYALPMDSQELAVTADPTERVQYYSQSQQKWIDGAAPASDSALWTRKVTLRQYGLGGIIDVDGNGVLDPALPSGAPSSAVHAKEIEVQVVSGGTTGNPFGLGKKITLKVFKTF